MGFGLVFCELCPSQWGTACYDLDVFGHVGGVWMCHFLYGRDGFDGTYFGWAGESFFFFILSIFHSLFLILCSVPLFLLFFSSSSYELADKSEKKRLICGNLVSLVCDDDVVYLIYIHIRMCVRT